MGAAGAAARGGASRDWCHIDFVNVSGILQVKGFKQVNLAANECLEANVDVAKGEILSCASTPCEIN